mmetsp:Transcript_17528/g.42053  ORF Transcript_17528/g.42053 Transcript_17528/m.42053 type:complete len:202 (-) Transcript_17528:338-943(-)
MMSQEVTVPNREKMISRSSSVVTGLSLQTKIMLEGGLTSASGRSPIISSTTARDFACSTRMLFSISSAFRLSSSGTQSSSSRSVSVSNSGSGEASGRWSASSGGSGKGSSSMSVCRIRMFCSGLSSLSVKASLMLMSTSMPSATSPNMVCFPSSESRSFPVVMKNCEAFMFSPPFAMETVPLRLCLRCGRISSSKHLACSP